MKCPECGKEMRSGYLFSSKDGAFSFANTVPGVFENAKKAEGFPLPFLRLNPIGYQLSNNAFIPSCPIQNK